MTKPTRKPRSAGWSFTPEFMAGTVRLVLEEARSPVEVARDLDLTETSLRDWGR